MMRSSKMKLLPNEVAMLHGPTYMYKSLYMLTLATMHTSAT